MVTIDEMKNIIGVDAMDFQFKGLSTDAKPTIVNEVEIAPNSLFLELDTGDFYYFNGSTWNKIGE